LRALFCIFNKNNCCCVTYYFLGPGLPRRVPSFFNRRPCASRGALLPGFGPLFLGVEVFVDLAVVVLVLFFDPAGRPRFFGAELVLAVDVGALAAFADVVLFDPAGRPRFFGAADFTVFVAFDVAALVLLTAASAASAVDSLTLSAALLVFSTALLVAALAFSPAVFDRSRAVM